MFSLHASPKFHKDLSELDCHHPLHFTPQSKSPESDNVAEVRLVELLDPMGIGYIGPIVAVVVSSSSGEMCVALSDICSR